MTTFDRYLLSRFWHAFAILGVSTFGLYVVIDAFTNVDAFQQEGDGAIGALVHMAGYYMYRSSVFFDMVGSILAVIAVMVVFALMCRHGEIHPILAAGIPTYRLVVAPLIGTVLVTLALVANQELIIPRISHHLDVGRRAGSEAHHVEPVYDQSLIYISGKQLLLDEHRLNGALFLLPAPAIADEITNLRASEAVYCKKDAACPGGWLLRGVTPKLADISLTAHGREIILARKGRDDELFVISDITSDQLYNRSKNFKYVSTPELISRVSKPSGGPVSLHAQSLHLHERLMRPFINLLAVLVAVPLIVRREGTGVVTNLALCTGVLGLLFGATQLFHYIGSANLLACDVSAWGPVVLGGTLSAWLSGIVQT